MIEPGFRGMGRAPDSLSYIDRVRKAQGFVVETFPRLWARTTGVLVSGTAYFAQVYLNVGEPLSNCHVAIGAAPNGLTLGRIGLWDTSGNLLTSCADQSASWTTVGVKSQSLSLPFTPQVSGIYFAGIICVASTTAPALYIATTFAATRIGLMSGLAGAPVYIGAQSGQSNLPNPLSVAAAANPGLPWLAFS